MTDRMHPDDLARKITALAEENGYGVTKLDLVSMHMVNRAVAHHSYASGYIISQEMSGRGKVAMTAPLPKDTR